jgi:branched-chain amino acid transport system permease protein
MGQAAFMAVGAYTTAILSTRYGLSPWATLPLSGIAAGLIGLVFAVPALRIKGFYLVMSTIAAQFIIIWYLGWAEGLTGGYYGMPVPKITIGGEALSYVQYWWLTLGLVVVAIFLVKNTQRTTVGRTFVAVRDNDKAAEVMGINLFRTKLLAFFIGCFFAGIAGWLWAHFFLYISPNQFAFKTSLWLLGMIIIGGMGSTTGAVLGVVAIRFMDKMVDELTPVVTSAFPGWSGQIAPALSLIVFAAVVIFFILVEPKGLYHRVQRIILYYRLYPFSYQR